MAMTRRKGRLIRLGLIVFVAAVSATLIGYGFWGNITLFVSPTDILAKQYSPEQRIRIGGLVEAGSVTRDGKNISFVLTDMENSVTVHFDDILPDLFKEEQGVVVEGHLGADKIFIASSVLAKHDENYMPKEVVDSLKASGNWQEGTQ